ncbi:MAG: RNA polymerase sigma factor [Chloroflexota bacterium]
MISDRLAGTASPDDERLCASLRDGDQEALAELYDRHSSAAYGLAARMVGSAEAEDVVHDAFIVLVKDPMAFDPARGAFRPWLLRVVHNRCVNALRGWRSAGEDGLAALHDPSRSPAEEVITSLSASAVRESLRELPAEQREALVLAYYGGLSHTELSAKLDVPLGTVKSRVRRGLLTLRDRVSGEALP